MAPPDVSLRETFLACLCLFKRYSDEIKDCGINGTWVDDKTASLRIWGASLGVLAEQHASLEHRLRDSEDMRSLVIQFLEGLRSNLSFLTEQSSLLLVNKDSDAMSTLSRIFEEKALGWDGPLTYDRGGDGDDQADTEAEASFIPDSSDLESHSSRSGQSDDSSECSEHLDVPICLGQVDALLKRLNRLASAIRVAGTHQRDNKAEIYRHVVPTADGDFDMTASFQEYADDVVDHRLANAATFLRRRIASSIARRQNRFLYRRKHGEKLEGAVNGQESAPSEMRQENNYQMKRRKSGLLSVTSKSNYFPRASPTYASVGNTTASIMPILATSPSQYSRSDISTSASLWVPYTSGGTVKFPPPPTEFAGDYFLCPFCSIWCHKKLSKTPKWEKHVIRDMDPFVCVFQACSKANELFCSVGAWLSHMSAEHTTKSWFCSYSSCLDVSTSRSASFDSQNAYFNHVQQAHNIQMLDAEFQFLSEMSVRPTKLVFENCPFCGDMPEGIITMFEDDFSSDLAQQALQQHISDHLYELSFISTNPNWLDYHEGENESLVSDGSAAKQLSWQSGLSSLGGFSRFIEGSSAMDDENLELHEPWSDIGHIYPPDHIRGKVRLELFVKAWTDSLPKSAPELVLINTPTLVSTLPRSRSPDELTPDTDSSVLRPDANESAEELDTQNLGSKGNERFGENDSLTGKARGIQIFEPSLREQLGEAQYEPWQDNRYFIPRNDLRRLISPESVLRQMKMETGLGRTPIQEQTALMISECAHKLYAALVFTRLGRHICDFLEEGIDDSDLPFVRLDSPDDSRTFTLCSKKSPREPLKCLVAWDRSDVRELAKTQWCMLAPVLEFTDKIEHYDFDRHCILPWIEDHEFSSLEHKGGAVAGGFGSVWKVKIHPAHQRLVRGAVSADRRPSQVSSLPTAELECPHVYVALKRLHFTDEESFNSEVAILKELRGHLHDHLVKLLATFRWNNRYYLLFPCADSNLREYWRANPLPAFSYKNVFWVLQQCRAITSGLYVVHEQLYKHAPSGNSNHDGQSRYGRHGDLKAENILWFREGLELGRLVIADFGSSDLHRRSSRSHIPAGHITGSPSYEPPELTLHESISRSYDIWTLGCLYLELITWLVSGWEALERFPDARREQVPQEPNLMDDTFFTIMAGSPGVQLRCAIIRNSVSSWILDLHEVPRSSGFVHDFLDLISNHMLVVDPVARIRIAYLNCEIQDMIAEAERNPSYLTEGVPYKPRTQPDPHQSSLAAFGLKGNKFPGTADGTPLPR